MKPNKIILGFFRTVIKLMPKKYMEKFLKENYTVLVAEIAKKLKKEIETENGEINAIAAFSLGPGTDEREGETDMYFTLTTLRQNDQGKIEHGREIIRRNVSKEVDTMDFDNMIESANEKIKELKSAEDV